MISRVCGITLYQTNPIQYWTIHIRVNHLNGAWLQKTMAVIMIQYDFALRWIIPGQILGAICLVSICTWWVKHIYCLYYLLFLFCAIMSKEVKWQVISSNSEQTIFILIDEMFHYISLHLSRLIDTLFTNFLITNIKGTNVFSSDFLGLPCLMQLYTRLHLSDYRKFWNTERCKSFN